MHVVLLCNTVQSVLVQDSGYSLQHCYSAVLLAELANCNMQIGYSYSITANYNSARGLAPMVFICISTYNYVGMKNYDNVHMLEINFGLSLAKTMDFTRV